MMPGLLLSNYFHYRLQMCFNRQLLDLDLERLAATPDKSLPFPKSPLPQVSTTP
jgi:hypothetical protein